MPINLDVFVLQLGDLGVSRYFLRGAVGMLRSNGALGSYYSVSPSLPGPQEEELLGLEARKEARNERRLREMLTRMSYVYSWSCLEDLLEQCVREVLLSNPQRVLDVGDWWRDGRLIRKQVVDGWDRDRVVGELIDTAVQSFRRLPFPAMPKYFAKRLEVTWLPEWQRDLLRIVEMRNQAAHCLQFSQPAEGQVEADLLLILQHGVSIARATAAKHGLECRVPNLEEARSPLLMELAQATGEGEGEVD